MIYGRFFSGWFHQCALATVVVQWGDASIEVRPRLEDRYLSLDRQYAIDLDWEHRWLYIPNNERPPLPTFSHDRLRTDTPKLWSRPPTLLEPQHLRLLLDAIDYLKDRGLMVPRVIHTFFSRWVIPLKMGHP